MTLLPTIIAAIAPFIDPSDVGGSKILAWVLTLALIAGGILFVIWAVTKLVGGPPSVPEPFRWIIWVLVAILLLVVLFAGMGIHLP